MDGLRLSEIMKIKKKSGKVLADETGNSIQSISNWRQGSRNPSITNIYLMAEKLNVDVNYLLNKDNTEIPPNIYEPLQILKNNYETLSNIGKDYLKEYWDMIEDIDEDCVNIIIGFIGLKDMSEKREFTKLIQHFSINTKNLTDYLLRVVSPPPMIDGEFDGEYFARWNKCIHNDPPPYNIGTIMESKQYYYGENNIMDPSYTYNFDDEILKNIENRRNNFQEKIEKISCNDIEVWIKRLEIVRSLKSDSSFGTWTILIILSLLKYDESLIDSIALLLEK